jgi:hypothetical protein
MWGSIVSGLFSVGKTVVEGQMKKAESKAKIEEARTEATIKQIEQGSRERSQLRPGSTASNAAQLEGRVRPGHRGVPVYWSVLTLDTRVCGSWVDLSV